MSHRLVLMAQWRYTSAVNVDVSDLCENVVWENDQSKVLGVESCIFYLISSDQTGDSRAVLAKRLGETACAARLFRYGRCNLADREQFTATLAETVAAEAERKVLRICQISVTSLSNGTIWTLMNG